MKELKEMTLKEKALFYKEFAEIIEKLENDIDYYKDNYNDNEYFVNEYIKPKTLVLNVLKSLNI